MRNDVDRQTVWINGISCILVGVILLLTGIDALVDGGYYSKKYARFISYGDHPTIVAAFLFVTGTWVLVVGLRPLIRKRHR